MGARAQPRTAQQCRLASRFAEATSNANGLSMASATRKRWSTSNDLGAQVAATACPRAGGAQWRGVPADDSIVHWRRGDKSLPQRPNKHCGVPPCKPREPNVFEPRLSPPLPGPLKVYACTNTFERIAHLLFVPRANQIRPDAAHHYDRDYLVYPTMRFTTPYNATLNNSSLHFTRLDSTIVDLTVLDWCRLI